MARNGFRYSFNPATFPMPDLTPATIHIRRRQGYFCVAGKKQGNNLLNVDLAHSLPDMLFRIVTITNSIGYFFLVFLLSYTNLKYQAGMASNNANININIFSTIYLQIRELTAKSYDLLYNLLYNLFFNSYFYIMTLHRILFP